MSVRRVDSEGKLARLLTTAVQNHCKESGESPTMLIDFEKDGLLCHRSLIKSRYSYLLSCIEQFYIKSDDMEEDTGSTDTDLPVKISPASHLDKVRMLAILYFIYTGEMVELEGIVRIVDLTLFSASYKVLDLVRLGTMEICLRDRSGVIWTYGQGVGAGVSFANCLNMDCPFEKTWKVPNASMFGKIPCRNYVPTDLWDFKGKSVGYEKTPRQMGFEELDLNFLEFDEKSFNLLKKDGNEMKDFVKIDFELENVATKRGVVRSPTIKGGEFWWMILVEFPKKLTDGTDPDPGVYLVCRGPNNHGGGASWSCDVSGSIVLVNYLDRTKDICYDFTKVTNFSNEADENGFIFHKFKEDIGIIINGSLNIKVRVLVNNYKIINSPRYNKMLERRKFKEVRSSGVEEDKNVVVHDTTKKRKTLKTKKISPSIKAAGDDMEQIIEETDELPKHGKINDHATKQTLTESNGVRKEKIPSVCGQAVCQTEKCEKLVKDSDGECECFKQDICRSLSAMALSRDAAEVDPEDCQESVEEGKTMKRKRRKAVVKCYLPSCNEKARHRCSRCLGVRYCSQGCNDQHWAVHRVECRDMEERVRRDREAGLD